MKETFEQKSERMQRVHARYDELTREDRHGHYETMGQVVREEVERALREHGALPSAEALMSGVKVVVPPEFKARYAFDAKHNVEPCRVIAERIADRHGHSGVWRRLVDDIANAIEDARELGEKRGRAALSRPLRNEETKP